MNKKEVIGIILFIVGSFLLGSTPSPTGAIIGIPVISSSFIGLICFLSSIAILMAGGLEKLTKGKITKTRDLVRILRKVPDLKIRKGRRIEYKGVLIGVLPEGSKIDPYTAKRIIDRLDDYE